MKPTFRKFIEDIEVDSSAYSHDDADNTIDTMQTSIRRGYNPEKPRSSWKELPVKFAHEGFKVIYKKNSYGEHDIALIDTRDLSKFEMPFGFALPKDANRIVVNLNVSKTSYDLLAEDGKEHRLMGLKTDVLSGARSYRGSGLAPMLYSTLVEHGQVLFSSTTQTPGGQSTWQRLTKSIGHVGDAAVIIHRTDAYRYIERHKDLNKALIAQLKSQYNDDDDDVDLYDAIDNHDIYLLIGPWAAMNKVAYDHEDTKWVIAPHGVLDRYKKFAIHVK